MKPITLPQLRQAVSGKNLAPLPADAPAIRFVCTDTRQMQPQSCFVALRGDRFDGHRFLAQAAAAGAIVAVVDTPPAEPIPGLHLLLVPDTRIALGKIATAVRKQLRSKVIGVAGSNGKTSTKHLIHAALAGRLRGSISPKSYNNDIGVPLTILPADASQDYLVLEMGTNHPGEIRTLTKMALPDIAVITNCGAEHLEGLGDLAGVRKENATIIEGLPATGLLVVNGDDEALLEAVGGYGGKRLTFGFKSSNDLFATEVRCDTQGVRFRLNNSRREIFVPLLGRHTAANALAAIAVARKLAVPEETVYQGLAQATGAAMRLQLQEIGGMRLLNDAYNANPSSMKAALETLAVLPAAGRRIAILGDMLELGPTSEALHRELGTVAAAGGVDQLVCVGSQASLIAEAAGKAGMAASAILHFPTADAAAAEVQQYLRTGDLILLKASRGIHLETIAAALESSLPPAQKVAS
jgi:UDP-N-acetylmuramoyl-tripeptide--D-alanyl-D-alanine ligase